MTWWPDDWPRRVKLDEAGESLLTAVGRGHIHVVGVLADHLEERGHPLAPELRKLLAEFEDGVRQSWATDWSKKRDGTRWQALACDSNQLRFEISYLFGRRWEHLNERRIAVINGILPKYRKEAKR
jgi:hypothetical protein